MKFIIFIIEIDHAACKKITFNLLSYSGPHFIGRVITFTGLDTLN